MQVFNIINREEDEDFNNLEEQEEVEVVVIPSENINEKINCK